MSRSFSNHHSGRPEADVAKILYPDDAPQVDGRPKGWAAV